MHTQFAAEPGEGHQWGRTVTRTWRHSSTGAMGSTDPGTGEAGQQPCQRHTRTVGTERSKSPRRQNPRVRRSPSYRTTTSPASDYSLPRHGHQTAEGRPKPTSESKRSNAGSRDAGDDRSGGGGGAGDRSLKDAIRRARNQEWRSRIRKTFTGKFYTPSTLAAKNTKRKRVVEILEAMETTFPLGINDLVGLASVLDAASMKAGDQYLAEAKAMHVEASFDWSGAMEAHLTMCRRALRRDRGPETRAKEVKLQDTEEETWEMSILSRRNPQRVAWSYAWAVVWMLRATEAANVLVHHVSLDRAGRKVTLHIPKSKTDQEAAGTDRTLGCCGQNPCGRHCPVTLAVRALADRPEAKPEDPMFPDYEGRTVSKLQMVTAWTKHLDPGMTGHSARRSGAMLYTRMGLDVQTVGLRRP